MKKTSRQRSVSTVLGLSMILITVLFGIALSLVPWYFGLVGGRALWARIAVGLTYLAALGLTELCFRCWHSRRAEPHHDEARETSEG
jgi:hypothetical protein